MARIYKGKVFEGCAAVFLARVYKENGSLPAVADISSIAVKVFNLKTGEQVGTTLSVTPADAVYAALQTDERWSEDDDGYNLAITVAGTYFPDGNTRYRVQAKLTPTSGNVLPAVWEVDSLDLLGE